MNTIRLQQRGIVTLPKKLRDSLGLEEGQILHVEHTDGKIVLEPQQTIFDRQLAADIKRGIEDLKSGRFIEFSTIEEYDAKMKNHAD